MPETKCFNGYSPIGESERPAISSIWAYFPCQLKFFDSSTQCSSSFVRRRRGVQVISRALTPRLEVSSHKSAPHELVTFILFHAVDPLRRGRSLLHLISTSCSMTSTSMISGTVFRFSSRSIFSRNVKVFLRRASSSSSSFSAFLFVRSAIDACAPARRPLGIQPRFSSSFQTLRASA